jgi:hypothetical protein
VDGDHARPGSAGGWASASPVPLAPSPKRRTISGGGGSSSNIHVDAASVWGKLGSSYSSGRTQHPSFGMLDRIRVLFCFVLNCFPELEMRRLIVPRGKRHMICVTRATATRRTGLSRRTLGSGGLAGI